jgi:hypothetical protein
MESSAIYHPSQWQLHVIQDMERLHQEIAAKKRWSQTASFLIGSHGISVQPHVVEARRRDSERLKLHRKMVAIHVTLWSLRPLAVT